MTMFADAMAYERFTGRWSRLLSPLLLEFAEIPDGCRILDVGSGTGSWRSKQLFDCPIAVSWALNPRNRLLKWPSGQASDVANDLVKFVVHLIERLLDV
jgi:hypothetical protein